MTEAELEKLNTLAADAGYLASDGLAMHMAAIVECPIDPQECHFFQELEEALDWLAARCLALQDRQSCNI